jgi:hypothetical protein
MRRAAVMSVLQAARVHTHAAASISSAAVSPTTIPTARVLDGRRWAAEWLDESRAQLQQLRQQGAPTPKLAVILVGSRPDSCIYVWYVLHVRPCPFPS